VFWGFYARLFAVFPLIEAPERRLFNLQNVETSLNRREGPKERGGDDLREGRQLEGAIIRGNTVFGS
jgi:hypothetical protein